MRLRIVAVKRYAPSRVPTALQSIDAGICGAYPAVQCVSRLVCGSRLQSFEQQLFCTRLVLLNRAAPPVEDIVDQDRCDTDPRVSLRPDPISSARSKKRQRLLLASRTGSGRYQQRPAAHYQIAGASGASALSYPARSGVGHRLHELEISEGSGQTADDLALASANFPVGLEAVCPKMTAGLGVDQLRVDPNPVARPSHAASMT